MKIITEEPATAREVVDFALFTHMGKIFPYNLAAYALQLPKSPLTKAYFNQFKVDRIGLSMVCPGSLIEEIDKLDDNERTLIYDRFLYGKTLAAIGGEHSCGAESIRTKIVRIVKQLTVDGKIFGKAPVKSPIIENLNLTTRAVNVIGRATHSGRGARFMSIEQAAPDLMGGLLIRTDGCGPKTYKEIVDAFKKHGYDLEA